MNVYEPHAVETRWQEKWEERKPYHVGEDQEKEKLYILEMFP